MSNKNFPGGRIHQPLHSRSNKDMKIYGLPPLARISPNGKFLSGVPHSKLVQDQEKNEAPQVTDSTEDTTSFSLSRKVSLTRH